ATGRRCETHEKISPALLIARWWKTQNRRHSKTSTAIFVATIARWWTTQNRRHSKTSTAWPRWLPDVGAKRMKKSHQRYRSQDGE
ncbi:MAG: hypothetical protein ACK54R_01595, partial [Pirellulaceae bacterium]